MQINFRKLFNNYLHSITKWSILWLHSVSEAILLHCENTDFIALSDVYFCFILVFGLFDVKVLYRVFFCALSECALKWFPWYNCAWFARQHAWPEPHLEYMGYFQEKDEKPWIQQYRRAESSIVPQQRHRLIVSIRSSLMLEFVLKEPRPSIESRNDHTLKILNLSVLQILFLIDLRKYSNILRYWMFDFHEL